MTRSDDLFEQELLGRFEAMSPLPDDAFTASVVAALPRTGWLRPVILVLAGMLGVLVASLQLPELVFAMDRIAAGLGVAAIDTMGAQALAMGIVAVGLGAVTLVLFRRGNLTL
ncbi:hypothetical protein X907_0787 [Glycocaulis alkaliphilus]|uniref:Uncharacterized protein n=1 Tax=Glycocaulis alkaliphilus TaxID=1434191 RepID=A0A3T0E7F7_9PROT|nr:hypothetical protein [Glycocaulis alkaliphilus]AZU03331.1 hypothetical protein X907_0787 [Glycocaulis alkaliphilus]GGB72804.1 hypothetical protein GCM10007417_10800 [Glycocaulis alkaliphilus]